MKWLLLAGWFYALAFLSACVSPASFAPTPTIPVPTEKILTVDDLNARLKAPDDITRLDAIARLEANGSADAVIILGEFFMNSDVAERFQAARALLRIGTQQSQHFIRTAMTDKTLTARRQVAMQALEANAESIYPFLEELLRDPEELVRLNTVQVVQFIGTGQARTLLQNALSDPSPAVQQAAADALAGMGYVPTPSP